MRPGMIQTSAPETGTCRPIQVLGSDQDPLAIARLVAFMAGTSSMRAMCSSEGTPSPIDICIADSPSANARASSWAVASRVALAEDGTRGEVAVASAVTVGNARGGNAATSWGMASRGGAMADDIDTIGEDSGTPIEGSARAVTGIGVLVVATTRIATGGLVAIALPTRRRD